jgi:hypothetical protein
LTTGLRAPPALRALSDVKQVALYAHATGFVSFMVDAIHAAAPVVPLQQKT